MTGPVELLETGLYNKLNVAAVTDLATGGIWDTNAPKDTSYPYVIFQHSAGGDENLTKSRMRSVVYIVKAVSNVKNTAADISEKIDDALHHQTLTVTGYTNFWTARQQDFRIGELTDNGIMIYHVGGFYRIRIGE